MNISYRALLAVAALVILIAMMRKIRKSEVRISDSLFWLFFVVTLIVLAIFPEIAFLLSDLLGIESPANLVFLYVIAVLLIREFMTTAELSRLQSKIVSIAQDEALSELEEEAPSQLGEKAI